MDDKKKEIDEEMGDSNESNIHHMPFLDEQKLEHVKDKVKELEEKNKGLKLMNFKHVQMTRFTFVVLIFTVLIFIANLTGFIVGLHVKEYPDSTKSSNIFCMLEAILMFVLILVPTLVKDVTKRIIPVYAEIAYIIFCIGGIICGEIYDFYGRYFWWDSLLHSMSGVLLGILGYIIINTFNHFENQKFKFSPLFVALWVICFALACGAVWELFEYSADEIFGSNMQQYKELDSTMNDSPLLMGHAALSDTMKDLALDFGGAIIAALIGVFEMKKNIQGISSMELQKLEDVKKK